MTSLDLDKNIYRSLKSGRQQQQQDRSPDSIFQTRRQILV